MNLQVIIKFLLQGGFFTLQTRDDVIELESFSRDLFSQSGNLVLEGFDLGSFGLGDGRALVCEFLDFLILAVNCGLLVVDLLCLSVNRGLLAGESFIQLLDLQFFSI